MNAEDRRDADTVHVPEQQPPRAPEDEPLPSFFGSEGEHDGYSPIVKRSVPLPAAPRRGADR